MLDKDKENKGECIEENKRFASPSAALNSWQNLNANTVLSVLDMIYHYGAGRAGGAVNRMPLLSFTGEMRTELWGKTTDLWLCTLRYGAHMGVGVSNPAQIISDYLPFSNQMPSSFCKKYFSEWEIKQRLL